MKYFLGLLVTFLLVATYFETCSAVSEPVCGYENSQGKLIFLKYFQGIQEGQEYLDNIGGGKCKKATCQSDYTLKIEEVEC